MKRARRAFYDYREPLALLNGADHFRRDVTTIAKLPDEVLLSTFGFYLDTSPRYWHRLVHVCKKWRHIIFASPRGLRLRLYCTYGTPVSEALDHWPALPIVMQYGGSPTLHSPGPKDVDNIVAALKQFDRVRSISLTVTTSLLKKLGTMEEPLSELEDLVLLSQNSNGLVLPGAFRWGSRLRSLHATGIAFHSLPRLLSSSQNLVNIQVHRIPSFGYFSPEAFVNALAGMPQLQSISLHFISLPSRRDHIGVPPKSEAPVVLPALSRLDFRGTGKYLNSLLARIDAPCLQDIEIFFFNQLTFDVSQLGKFIDRTEIQKSHRRADIIATDRAISISFTQPGTPTRLDLHISCEPLDWQLFCMIQICNHFSTFLFRVEDLRINATRPSSVQGDVDDERWLELIRWFGRARTLRVSGNLAPEIMRALRPDNKVLEIVLPILRNLYVKDSGPLQTPLREDMVSLVVWRRLSGCPISVGYIQPSEPPVYLCLNCEVGFTQHQLFSGRMTRYNKPDARIWCHFCHRFTCSQGRTHIYQEHLRRRHPDVASQKLFISDPIRDFNPEPRGTQNDYRFASIVSKSTDTRPRIPWLLISKIAEFLKGDIDDSPLSGRPLAPSLEPASFPEDAWVFGPHSASTFFERE